MRKTTTTHMTAIDRQARGRRARFQRVHQLFLTPSLLAQLLLTEPLPCVRSGDACLLVTLRETRPTPSARLHLRVLSLSLSPSLLSFHSRENGHTRSSSPSVWDQNLPSPFPSDKAQVWLGGAGFDGSDAVSLESVSRLFTSTMMIGARCLLSSLEHPK